MGLAPPFNSYILARQRQIEHRVRLLISTPSPRDLKQFGTACKLKPILLVQLQGPQPQSMRNHVLYSFLSLIGLKKNKSRRSRAEAANESSLPEGLYRQFSLNEILAATFNFDSKLVIGRGGSGTVYKGFMDDGTLVVAVKRLRPVSRKKAVEEFRNEVQLLCQLRHQNLVALIGFCHDKDEKILVYSYMSNGSLYDHLHGNNGNDPLSWKQRLGICIGAARGLHYLHIGAKRAIIHRDIKPQNILLDDQLASKISDFGFSKIGPRSMSKALIRMESDVKGSVGYLDPEYLQTKFLSEKSDVYSFGALLLEVVCGTSPIEPRKVGDEIFLVDWACKCIENGSIYNIIDPHLKGKIAPDCFKQFVEIAFSCLKVNGNERPSMGEVEMTLELALELQNKADSEIERINPNGDCVYEDAIFFAPHLSSGVKPLQLDDYFDADITSVDDSLCDSIEE